MKSIPLAAADMVMYDVFSTLLSHIRTTSPAQAASPWPRGDAQINRQHVKYQRLLIGCPITGSLLCLMQFEAVSCRAA